MKIYINFITKLLNKTFLFLFQGNHVTKVVSNVTYPKNLEMAPRPMVKPIVPSDIKNQGQKSGFMAHSSTGSFEVNDIKKFLIELLFNFLITILGTQLLTKTGCFIHTLNH